MARPESLQKPVAITYMESPANELLITTCPYGKDYAVGIENTQPNGERGKYVCIGVYERRAIALNRHNRLVNQYIKKGFSVTRHAVDNTPETGPLTRCTKCYWLYEREGIPYGIHLYRRISNRHGAEWYYSICIDVHLTTFNTAKIIDQSRILGIVRSTPSDYHADLYDLNVNANIPVRSMTFSKTHSEITSDNVCEALVSTYHSYKEELRDHIVV